MPDPKDDTVVQGELERIRKAFEKAGETELFEKYASEWAPLLEWKNRTEMYGSTSPADQVETATLLRDDADRGQSFQGAVDPAELSSRPWRGAYDGSARALMGPGEPVPHELAKGGAEAQERAMGKVAGEVNEGRSLGRRALSFADNDSTYDLARPIEEGRKGVDDITERTVGRKLFEPTNRYSKAARAAMAKDKE